MFLFLLLNTTQVRELLSQKLSSWQQSCSQPTKLPERALNLLRHTAPQGSGAAGIAEALRHTKIGSAQPEQVRLSSFILCQTVDPTLIPAFLKVTNVGCSVVSFHVRNTLWVSILKLFQNLIGQTQTAFGGQAKFNNIETGGNRKYVLFHFLSNSQVRRLIPLKCLCNNYRAARRQLA